MANCGSFAAETAAKPGKRSPKGCRRKMLSWEFIAKAWRWTRSIPPGFISAPTPERFSTRITKAIPGACWLTICLRSIRSRQQLSKGILPCKLWLVHPIAVKLGPLPIHWYGVMVALGFLAGLWTASRRGLRDGIAAEKILDLGPWLILGAILGARTLYVTSYWREQFAGKPIWEAFMIQHDGLG